MKTKFLKIVTLVFCMALFLTGCATVSDVLDKNGKQIYFEDPVYFQGQVAKVGDYLYYANAYVDVSTEGSFNYEESAKVAYLNRINLEDIKFADDVWDENYDHTSPLGIEKVNGDKLVGYQNQQMYAYGSYLYFTSASVHKTEDMLNEFDKISLFRVAFNGDGLTEIGTFGNDENSTITLQKGSDGKAYFVIVAPSENGSEKETATDEENKVYDIISIQVGDSIGKQQILVEDVEDAVVADNTSTKRDVVYTYAPDEENLVSAISSVDFATGDITIHDGGGEEAVNLIDRVGDEVFYSYKNEVYFKNVNIAGTFSASNGQRFYSAPSISEIEKVGNGYIFKGTSTLIYKESLTASSKALISSADYAGSQVLFVDGEYIYISSTSEIARITVEGEKEVLVSGMTIVAGQCGYDGDYVYFYANRGELQIPEGEEPEQSSDGEETEEVVDNNQYLYQVDKNGNIQLLSYIEDKE